MVSHRRLRVLHLVPSLEMGGAERSLIKLAAGLHQSEFESVVVSMTGNDPLGVSPDEAGVRRRALGMPRGRATPQGRSRFRDILREYVTG